MSDKSTTTDAAPKPVSLPARGIDATALDKGLSKAVQVKDETKRGDAISRAIVAAQPEGATKEGDPATLPGHKWIERHDGRGGVERTQVFDPSSDYAKAHADDEANPVPASDHRLTAETVSDKTSPKLVDVKEDAPPAVPQVPGEQGQVSAGSEDAGTAADEAK